MAHPYIANLALLFRETAQDNGFCFCRFEANIGFWRRRIFFDAFDTRYRNGALAGNELLLPAGNYTFKVNKV